MHRLSSTKLELPSPVLAQLLGMLPALLLPSPLAFKPTPVHFQGILLKLKTSDNIVCKMQLRCWICAHSHILCVGQEEHACTKTGLLSVCFSVFPLFSLLNMYSFCEQGRAPSFSLGSLLPPLQQVGLLSSVLSQSHGVCVSVHQPPLPAPPWTGISLAFLPIFSTRHEPLKAQGLACLLPPHHLTLHLAQRNLTECFVEPYWITTKPQVKTAPTCTGGRNSLFGRVSPPEYKLHCPVKDTCHSS